MPRPFNTGEQAIDWMHVNCSDCRNVTWVDGWPEIGECPILDSLNEDGAVSEAQAEAMGLPVALGEQPCPRCAGADPRCTSCPGGAPRPRFPWRCASFQPSQRYLDHWARRQGCRNFEDFRYHHPHAPTPLDYTAVPA